MTHEKLEWDFEQFEAGMEKEISHRKMLGSLSSTKHFSEVRISDQFFLFGLPPDTKKQGQTAILIAFPSFQQASVPISNVLALSFPNPETANAIFKFSLTDSPSNEGGIVDEFVFQFMARSTVMYGACVHVQPSKANKAASNTFYSSDSTKKSKFCFCMISKIPIFNVHFTFLHYLIGLSNGTIPTSKPKKQKGKKISSSNEKGDSLFDGLEINGLFGQIPQILVPEEFRSAITDHFAKTLFSSPVKLTPNYIIHFPLPATPIPKLILYASLDTLFSVLPIADILELLTALILDAQVLVIGTSMQEVSMTVYGLFSLLTPFNYCGTIMPILPNNEEYLNLLNSPTPYIFGMPNIAKLRNISFLESTYIVNLDKHKKTASNFFPKYPNFKSVVQKLADLILSKKLKKSSNLNDNDNLDLLKNRKDKCKSTVIETKPIKLKTALSSNVIKPPPPPPTEDQPPLSGKVQILPTKSSEKVQNESPEDENGASKVLKSRRMRSLTVTHKDYPQDIEQQQLQQPNGSNGSQLSDFPSLDKQSSMPEIANDSNPFKFPTEFTRKLNHKASLSMEDVDKVLDILHEPLDFIFSDTLNGYFVTNALENITIFNQSLFIASVKQEDQPFYEFLLESQTFQDYVEIKLDEFTTAKCADPSKRRRSAFGLGKTKRRRASTVKRVIKIFD